MSAVAGPPPLPTTSTKLIPTSEELRSQFAQSAYTTTSILDTWKNSNTPAVIYCESDGVNGEAKGISYCYTVGMPSFYDHPEVGMSHIDAKTAATIFGKLFICLSDGKSVKLKDKQYIAKDTLDEMSGFSVRQTTRSSQYMSQAKVSLVAVSMMKSLPAFGQPPLQLLLPETPGSNRFTVSPLAQFAL